MMTREGRTSVSSDIISPTSANNLLSKSPLCIRSTPRHSPLSIRAKKYCWNLFCAFTPITARTQVRMILSSISLRITLPNRIAVIARSPSRVPVAISVSRRTSSTPSNPNPTNNKPITMLTMAWTRNPLWWCQSHRTMVLSGYLVRLNLKTIIFLHFTIILIRKVTPP